MWNVKFKIYKQLLSFLLLISFIFGVSAQTATVDSVEQNLRKHVSYLASGSLEGRRTGEKGAVAAAGYAANMFANYKLKGGFVNAGKSGFLQSFPFTTAVGLGKENRLMATPPGNNRVAELQKDWMPFGASPDFNVSNAETIFAGFGIVSNEAGRDDYAGKNVGGKIVLAFDGFPANANSQNVLARFNVHAKAKSAKDRSATALILISREADFSKDKTAKLEYDPTLGETAVPVAIVSRSIGEFMFGGAEDFQKAERGEKVEEKIIKTLLKIELDKKSGQSYNVIGILEGTDFNLKNEAIVIGAHYDHLGRGGAGSLAANSREIHNGADDNASGVAALLELARYFSNSKTNKRTLVFIAFGGEEEGLLGSKFYVNNPVFPLDKTVAMINMDMVGRLKDNKLTVGGIGTASEWKSLVEERNKISGEFISFALQLNEDGFGPSDHASFYAKQVPVLFFFTGTHLDYHKPTDTAEKINYSGLNQITKYVSEIVKTVDANPKKPTYAVAKSSGTGTGRTGFNVTLGTIPGYAESNDGMVIDGVREDSPAAKSGLKAGDKITKLAGKEVRNVSDYTVILGELKAATEYEIVVLRGAEKLTLKIVPAARK